MNTYLSLFRDKLSSGALMLSKRVMLTNILAFLVLGIIGLVLITPLFLKSLGFGITDFMAYQQSVVEMNKSIMSGEDPTSVFSSFLGTVDFATLTIAILCAFVYYTWFINVMLTINDSEIRHGDNRLFSAIGKSFNANVLNLILHLILYVAFYMAVLIIFIFTVQMLMSVSKALGILVGFFGFFFVMMLLLRLILVAPAIVHGRMSVFAAWAYSFTNITWKRSGIILLLTFGLIVIFFILALIVAAIFGTGVGESGSISAGSMIVQQIVSLIVNAFILTFGLSLLSGLYFRYSEDAGNVEESDHLIADQP